MPVIFLGVTNIDGSSELSQLTSVQKDQPVNITKEMKDLLIRIKEENITRFEPLFETASGFTYSSLRGLGFKEQTDLLRRMEKEGFLTAELIDRVQQCQSCQSVEFSMKLSCAICKSN